MLFTFFALGWQISEIDPARLVTDFPQAMQPLGQGDLAVAGRGGPGAGRLVRGLDQGAETALHGRPAPDPPWRRRASPTSLADPSSGELSALDADNNLSRAPP